MEAELELESEHVEDDEEEVEQESGRRRVALILLHNVLVEIERAVGALVCLLGVRNL